MVRGTHTHTCTNAHIHMHTHYIELVIGFESPHFTFQEGDEGCSSKVRVCAELSGSITGLSVELVPVWREGTAMGESLYCIMQRS